MFDRHQFSMLGAAAITSAAMPLGRALAAEPDEAALKYIHPDLRERWLHVRVWLKQAGLPGAKAAPASLAPMGMSAEWVSG